MTSPKIIEMKLGAKEPLAEEAKRCELKGLKDRLGEQRGGSEWEPIKILLEGD
jgi:hypothetical protein